MFRAINYDSYVYMKEARNAIRSLIKLSRLRASEGSGLKTVSVVAHLLVYYYRRQAEVIMTSS